MQPPISQWQSRFFWAYGFISMLSILAALLYGKSALFLIGPSILIGYLAITDFKYLYYALLFFLPLSTEIKIGSLGTDLPSEPLMVALMFLFFLSALIHPERLYKKIYFHPIYLILALHYFWIFFTTLYSYNLVVSIKFFLAKTWYISTFLLLTPLIFNSVQRIKIFFWLIFIPLSLATAQVLIRYAKYGFDFEFVNYTMYPFFRNHVSYGAMLTSFFPFIVLAFTWYKHRFLLKIIIAFSIFFYIVAIYLSYTRMCYLALIAAGISYFIIKWRLIKYAIALSIVVTVFILYHFMTLNKYYKLSPQFEKTVTHGNFEDLLEATISMEDASSMERLYRWIAAFYMYTENPYTGHGPGNFYPYYKKFTVTEFRTYLSENEEQSTVHNYFLLLLVEQGIIGTTIFISLVFALLYYSEKMFHHLKNSFHKNIVMAAALSLVTAFVNLVFNDMLEADKTGSLFFISIAFLVTFGTIEMKNKFMPQKTITPLQ